MLQTYIINRMKQYILLAITLLVATFNTHATTTHKSEQLNKNGKCIFYALPMNELHITLTATHTWQQRGPFYRYAGRFLAIDNVVTEDASSWALTSISLNQNSVADTTQIYQITANKKEYEHLLALNAMGAICGINTPVCASDAATAHHSTELTMPALGFDKSVLCEEALVANSTAKMAEFAAKQIYRIRENRLSLITGELDFPADGQSLQTLLNEMNTMEQKLLELFVGKTVTQTVSQTLVVRPTANAEQVIARFSKELGIVAPDNLAGEPIYLKATPHKPNLNLHPTKQAKSGIRYRYACPTTIDIYDATTTFIHANYNIAQFGDVLILPELLTQNNYQLLFDAASGQLQQIKRNPKKSK